MNGKLTVSEIFFSIQGEGVRAGMPCIFVRLTGCNLRCVWCDTTYAYSGGTSMSFEEILGKIARFDCRLVEITGGEPLQQAGSADFIRLLCDREYTVLVETGGSLSLAPIDKRAVVIMDLKCPGSGMSEKNNYDNLAMLKKTDVLKFVIASRDDFLWAREQCIENNLFDRCTILFSPAFGLLEPKLLAEWILAEALPVRLQLQLHKYIWEPDQRGV